MKILNRLFFIGFTITSIFRSEMVSARTYDALCENQGKCQITIDSRGFSGPNGFIPQRLIAKWYKGGTEDYNFAKGTAGSLGMGTVGAVGGAVLLGPIGLLGGLAGGAIHGSKAGKDVDLYFTVLGYSEKGVLISQSFNFINKKPASQLSMDLTMLTGLAMGQERSEQELKESFKSGNQPSSIKRKTLPLTLDE